MEFNFSNMSACNIPLNEAPGFYVPLRGTKNALSCSLPTDMDPDKEYECALVYLDTKAFLNVNLMPQRNIVVYLQKVDFTPQGDIANINLFGNPITLYYEHYNNLDEMVASVNDSILFIMSSQGYTEPTLPRLIAEDKRCVVENLVLPSGNRIILALAGSLGSYFGFETFSYAKQVTATHEVLEYFNEIHEIHFTSTITGDATLCIKTSDDTNKIIPSPVYHAVTSRGNNLHLLELKNSSLELLPIYRYSDTLAVLHIREK